MSCVLRSELPRADWLISPLPGACSAEVESGRLFDVRTPDRGGPVTPVPGRAALRAKGEQNTELASARSLCRSPAYALDQSTDPHFAF